MKIMSCSQADVLVNISQTLIKKGLMELVSNDSKEVEYEYIR